MITKSIHKQEFFSAVFSMMMLYAGKTSGILVNLLFIPIYSLKLGPEEFGIVAVIFSLQALLIMLDMGMSTLLGRDIAAQESTAAELLRKVYSAELGLVFLYGVLMLALCVFTLAGGRIGINTLTFLAVALMILLLVLQNLYYSVIVARRSYSTASLLQLAGNLTRAGGTALVLIYLSPTLDGFVASQLTGAVLQAVASRYLCIREFRNDLRGQAPIEKENRLQCMFDLLVRARPLVLLSAAGAAVMQLDKPIISYFMSPLSVAPYFLAMTFSAFPSAVLATPVVQYFQPKLIEAISIGNDENTNLIIKHFTTVLMLVVALPCMIVWLWSESVISLWLHDSLLSISVSCYVKTLLPAFAIGSLFYVPVILLLSVQDFKYQSISSIVMAVATLLAVAYYANIERVDKITVVYLMYFVAASASVFFRSIVLPETRRFSLYCGRISIVFFVIFAAVFLFYLALFD